MNWNDSVCYRIIYHSLSLLPRWCLGSQVGQTGNSSQAAAGPEGGRGTDKDGLQGDFLVHVEIPVDRLAGEEGALGRAPDEHELLPSDGMAQGVGWDQRAGGVEAKALGRDPGRESRLQCGAGRGHGSQGQTVALGEGSNETFQRRKTNAMDWTAPMGTGKREALG